MLKERAPVWSLSEYERPLVTATYFGFTPIAAPKISEADFQSVCHCFDHPHYDAAEKAALIRNYIEHNFAALPHPLALIYRKPAVKKRLPGYALHFIGSSTGIAEASLIRAALSILKEEGYENLRVDINSIGDKDTIGVYERELHNHVRKSGVTLTEELRKYLKEDIWNLFRREEEQMIQLRATAPSSISFLTTQSRLHFKEVLEYLESLSVEFRLAPELVGEKNHCSHSIFAIKGVDDKAFLEERGESTLAVGYRYSRLSKRLGMKKEIPMVGVNIFFSPQHEEMRVYKQLPKAKFYLVQLGREAKMKTLNLIEDLRSHKIPVYHFLGKDKLAAQLTGAEELKVSYLIIIGHKEALDGTATVRNMQTRAQDTIPMSLLPQYLKRISL